MLFLALETTSLRASLGLFEERRCLRELFLPEGLVHGREVLAGIAALLREARLPARGLDGLAVSLGPGSYTGIRVGVTAAKTLAFALRIPLVGISSHEVLAAGAAADAAWETAERSKKEISGLPPERTSRLLVPLLDARKGFFYGALFEQDLRGESGSDGFPPRRRQPDQVGTVDAIRSWIEPGSRLFGAGADSFLEALRDDPLCRVLVRGPRAWDSPSARILGILAADALLEARFELEAIHPLAPAYLRASEPEIRWAQRRMPDSRGRVPWASTGGGTTSSKDGGK